MPHIHVHVHTNDAGTSEGARKAAITRKQHSGPAGTRVRSPEEHHRLAELYESRAATYRRQGNHAKAAEHEKKAAHHYKRADADDSLPNRDGSVEQTMHEYKHGELHSGSKEGPKVKSRKQAIAIALNQAGKSKDAATKDFLPG